MGRFLSNNDHTLSCLVQRTFIAQGLVTLVAMRMTDGTERKSVAVGYIHTTIN